MSFALSRKSFSNLYFYSNVLFFLSISIVAICFSITFFSNTVLAESQQYIFIKKWRSRCDNQGNGSCIHKNDGQFSDPTGLAIDSSDNVYIIDYFNHRVEKFKDDSTFITKWGSFGTKEGQLNYATGIAVDKDGFVYVTDTNNNRIQMFTSDGTFVSSCFGGGNTFGVAVDKYGFVYATFANGNVVKKFTNDYHLVTQWGPPGTGDGQFANPWGIGRNSKGNIYV
jgi:tripartite motif-containing protein 71